MALVSSGASTWRDRSWRDLLVLWRLPCQAPQKESGAQRPSPCLQPAFDSGCTPQVRIRPAAYQHPSGDQVGRRSRCGLRTAVLVELLEGAHGRTQGRPAGSGERGGERGRNRETRETRETGERRTWGITISCLTIGAALIFMRSTNALDDYYDSKQTGM